MKLSEVTAESEVPTAYRWRTVAVCLALLCGFGVMVFRFGHLQILQAEELSQRANRQYQRVIVLDSTRGGISDRKGRALALNIDVPSIIAEPLLVTAPSQAAQKLAPVLDMQAKTVERLLRAKKDWVRIKRKVSLAQGQQIQAMGLPGIDIEMEPQRFYPNGSLLAHVLGGVGIDSQGLEGLEYGYERFLKGQPQRVVRQKDARGHPIFSEGQLRESRISGHTITLSIDQVIQFIAERAIDRAVSETQARGGTILIMDPESGGILGWALRPTFDLNLLREAPGGVWRNRAVTDPYEPGSTLKAMLAAAALEEHVIELDTLVYAGGGEVPLNGTIIHDHTKAEWITFAEALVHSSNVVAVKTALSLSGERYYEYLREFGFGERTGIDLPGESRGKLKVPQDWSSRTLPSIAIGQEISVTPLQMVTAMSAIANHGWLMKPFVVQTMRDAEGQVVDEHTPEPRRRVISEKTASTLGSLLARVVNEGTGRRAAIPGYQVAGKTGTAQKFDVEAGQYSSSRFIASFLGYVPVEQPRLTILVMIDEPKGPAWGGVVAAPAFQEAAEQILRYLEVVPDTVEPMRLALASPFDSVQ
ncbi:MAG: hypothetical protein GKS05_08520 [Nitrospirales bacterium]|nr:hypothetical protein [Nitrospirales bacterium]